MPGALLLRTSSPLRSIGAACLAGLLLAGLSAAPAGATGSSSVSGTAFEDVDRDGLLDAGEPRLAGHRVELTSSTGQFWGATTDDAGHYAFASLAAGLYRVDVGGMTYAGLRDDWVPTTGTGLRPFRNLEVTGSTTADLGWRRIVRSTDPQSPLSTHTGPSGLRVESFDDVVPARELHDVLASGTLTGEAATTVVVFDLGGTSSTSSAYGQDGSRYSGFAARSYVTYASWRDRGAETLAHEHGHAWGTYHSAITQQDPTLAAYLLARGLDGDPRVGSGYAWMPGELLAEDYRQLLGPAVAAAGEQMNRELPRATDVPGLREFLTTVFTTPVPTASPSPEPAALVVDGLSTSTGKRGTTISFRASEAAEAQVRVVDGRGSLVRAVHAGRVPAGTTSVLWDGKDATGRRVRTTGLSVVVTLTDGARTASASAPLG